LIYNPVISGTEMPCTNSAKSLQAILEIYLSSYVLWSYNNRLSTCGWSAVGGPSNRMGKCSTSPNKMPIYAYSHMPWHNRDHYI